MIPYLVFKMARAIIEWQLSLLPPWNVDLTPFVIIWRAISMFDKFVPIHDGLLPILLLTVVITLFGVFRKTIFTIIDIVRGSGLD